MIIMNCSATGRPGLLDATRQACETFVRAVVCALRLSPCGPGPDPLKRPSDRPNTGRNLAIPAARHNHSRLPPHHGNNRLPPASGAYYATSRRRSDCGRHRQSGASCLPDDTADVSSWRKDNVLQSQSIEARSQFSDTAVSSRSLPAADQQHAINQRPTSLGPSAANAVRIFERMHPIAKSLTQGFHVWATFTAQALFGSEDLGRVHPCVRPHMMIPPSMAFRACDPR